MNTMTNVEKLIRADEEKLDKLVEENPIRLTIQNVCDFLETQPASIRAAIECGTFAGFAWRKEGKQGKHYYIPTAQFVRWYLRLNAADEIYRKRSDKDIDFA